jgi:hypothetical protein
MSPKKREAAGKSRATRVTFLGFSLHIPFRTLRNRILLLAGFSLLTKLLVLWATPAVFNSFIDLFDIGYYLNFAAKIYSGHLPYVQFSIDYPQGALLSILLPLVLVIISGGLPALAAGNPMGYVFFHQALMCLFDIGTVTLVYLIGLRLYDERRAFFAGILYATAFSAAYFVLTKYDSYPTFLLLLSVALFIYGRETGAYLAGAWGFLAKWFPVFALPYFVILDLKKGMERRVVLKNLGYSVILVLVVTLPFIVLNPAGFLQSYLINVQVNTLAHGFLFYLDFITKTLTGATFFSSISLFLAAAIELGLLYWYYRRPATDHLTLCAFIFFALFAFIMTNKISSPQYLQWIAPFVALFLAGSAREIVLFYVAQLWFFLEFPVFYNVIYHNVTGYLSAAGGFPTVPFLFFTVKNILLFLILWVVLKKLPGDSAAGKPSSA